MESVNQVKVEVKQTSRINRIAVEGIERDVFAAMSYITSILQEIQDDISFDELAEAVQAKVRRFKMRTLHSSWFLCDRRLRLFSACRYSGGSTQAQNYSRMIKRLML